MHLIVRSHRPACALSRCAKPPLPLPGCGCIVRQHADQHLERPVLRRVCHLHRIGNGKLRFLLSPVAHTSFQSFGLSSFISQPAKRRGVAVGVRGGTERGRRTRPATTSIHFRFCCFGGGAGAADRERLCGPDLPGALQGWPGLSGRHQPLHRGARRPRRPAPNQVVQGHLRRQPHREQQ